MRQFFNNARYIFWSEVKISYNKLKNPWFNFPPNRITFFLCRERGKMNLAQAMEHCTDFDPAPTPNHI